MNKKKFISIGTKSDRLIPTKIDWNHDINSQMAFLKSYVDWFQFILVEIMI